MADKGKSPAFQFYAAEWLADENVRLMTLEETGAYIDALAICWREGSIPADPERLARLIGKGCTVATATCVQLRFNIGSTEECSTVERLQHKRLNAEREKQLIRSRQMAEAGKKSASKKAQLAGAAISKSKVNLGSTQVQPKHNSSSSSLDEDGRVKRFIPPTVQEVEEYCRERGNKVDAQRFVSHYTSNGWKVGRNKMVDWRAAICNVWERDGFGNNKPKQGQFRDVFDEFLNDGGSNG